MGRDGARCAKYAKERNQDHGNIALLVTRTFSPLKDEGEKTPLDMFCSLLKFKMCADLRANLSVGMIVPKSYIPQAVVITMYTAGL